MADPWWVPSVPGWSTPKDPSPGHRHRNCQGFSSAVRATMKRKGFIAEGDVAMLLRRYESSTILSLLYEVSKCGSAKLNWAALVKDSNTGIRSPREYQALWRHLAYRTELEPVDADDVPLEDDGSDLEFELEPFPSVTAETANEASNYAKALMGFSTDIIAAHSEAIAHAERKKRKLWTMEEDQELAAGVEKYGEGNWAVILKNVFKHDRTASQLAQRWSLIKKRRETVAVPSQSSPVPARLIDAESVGSLRRQHSMEAATASKTDGKVQAPKQVSGPRPENLSRVKPAFPAIPRNNVMGSTVTRTVPVSSHVRTSSGLGPDPMVQAAAVAAGARIAPASTAATLLKSKNVVHVRPSNPTNSASTSTKNNGNTNNSNSNTPSRPGISQPVIHYIRTGTGAPPPMLSSLSKRPVKQGTQAAVVAVAGKNTLVNVSAVSASKSMVSAPLKQCSSNMAGSRLAIRNSKDGTIQEIMETSNKSKKKIIVARESNGLVRVSSNHQHVSSWYEVVEEPAVAVGSEENEDHGGGGGSVVAAASAMVTSSNESSGAAGLGLVTASPLSHSSGPSD